MPSFVCVRAQARNGVIVCTPLGQEQSLVSWQPLEKDPAPPRPPFQLNPYTGPPFGRVQICAHWTHEGAWLEGDRTGSCLAGLWPLRAVLLPQTQATGPAFCFQPQSSQIVQCTCSLDARVDLCWAELVVCLQVGLCLLCDEAGSTAFLAPRAGWSHGDHHTVSLVVSSSAGSVLGISRGN